jgi:hypothetical protein
MLCYKNRGECTQVLLRSIPVQKKNFREEKAKEKYGLETKTKAKRKTTVRGKEKKRKEIIKINK